MQYHYHVCRFLPAGESETGSQTDTRTNCNFKPESFYDCFFLFALNAFYAGKSFYAPESTLQYNLRSCSLISWEALKFNDLYNVAKGMVNGGGGEGPWVGCK